MFTLPVLNGGDRKWGRPPKMARIRLGIAEDQINHGALDPSKKPMNLRDAVQNHTPRPVASYTCVVSPSLTTLTLLFIISLTADSAPCWVTGVPLNADVPPSLRACPS